MSVKHIETFGKKKMERLAKDEGISVNHVLQLADWRHKFPFILFQSSTEILTAWSSHEHMVIYKSDEVQTTNDQ